MKVNRLLFLKKSVQFFCRALIYHINVSRASERGQGADDLWAHFTKRSIVIKLTYIGVDPQKDSGV